MMNQKKKLFRSRKGFRSSTESSKCRCFGRRLWLWRSARIPLGTWRWWVGTDIRWAACNGKKILFFCAERIERELTTFNDSDIDLLRVESHLIFERRTEKTQGLKPLKGLYCPCSNATQSWRYLPINWMAHLCHQYKDWGVPVELGKFRYKANKYMTFVFTEI